MEIVFAANADVVEDLDTTLGRAVAAKARYLSLDPAAMLPPSFAVCLIEERVYQLRIALQRARFEAEAVGVTLAIRVPCAAFEAGPMFWRDLIDDLVTPWIELDLDLARLADSDQQADWIAMLGPRIGVLRTTAAGSDRLDALPRGVRFRGLVVRSATTG